MMGLGGDKARLGTRLGRRTVTVRTLSSIKDSINQRLCLFQKFGMLILFLSSRFILHVGFTTIRTLMSFLAPEHNLAHLDDCIPRAASQDSQCICSSSQGCFFPLLANAPCFFFQASVLLASRESQRIWDAPKCLYSCESRLSTHLLLEFLKYAGMREVRDQPASLLECISFLWLL